MRRELVKDSKFLSLVLRHDPSVIGLELDESGWIDVATLLEAMREHRPGVTRERLVEIVETNDKKRFAFSEDRERIRASQGHSIGVELSTRPRSAISSKFSAVSIGQGLSSPCCSGFRLLIAVR